MSKIKPNTGVILLSYWEKRFSQLKKIVKAILDNGVKAENIVVVNNNPDKLPDVDVHVVDMQKNYGCLARQAIAILSDWDYVWFIDDDVLPEPGVLENMFSAYEPGRMLGYWGKQLGFGKLEPYDKGENFFADNIEYEESVDIILGKTMFLRADLLPQALNNLYNYPNFPRREDDILLSMTNVLAGGRNFVIPSEDGSKCLTLDERGVGNCHEQGHVESRNKASKIFVKEYLRNKNG